MIMVFNFQNPHRSHDKKRQKEKKPKHKDASVFVSVGERKRFGTDRKQKYCRVSVLHISPRCLCTLGKSTEKISRRYIKNILYKKSQPQIRESWKVHLLSQPLTVTREFPRTQTLTWWHKNDGLTDVNRSEIPLTVMKPLRGPVGGWPADLLVSHKAFHVGYLCGVYFPWTYKTEISRFRKQSASDS